MTNTNQLPTPKGFLKTFKIIHLGFTIAVLMFTLITLILVKDYNFSYFEDDSKFYILVPTFAIAGFFVGNFLFKKQLGEIDSKIILRQKLGQYQSASLIRYALAEGPALLSSVVFLMTENIIFFVIAIALIIYLYSLRPSKERVYSDLNLNNELRNQFEKNIYQN